MKNFFKFSFKKKSTARQMTEAKLSQLMEAERELIQSLTKTTDDFLKKFQ